LNSHPKPPLNYEDGLTSPPDVEQNEMECAEFQANMAERIGAGENLLSDPHLSHCQRCQRLVEELEAIAQAARLLLPAEEEPHEDLWGKIERAISHESA